MDVGCTKALLYLHKQDILSTLAYHYCLLNVKAELDQFCKGLQILVLLGETKDHSQVFQCLFVSGENSDCRHCNMSNTCRHTYYYNYLLWSVIIKRLLKQKYFSEKGSNSQRQKQFTSNLVITWKLFAK